MENESKHEGKGTCPTSHASSKEWRIRFGNYPIVTDHEHYEAINTVGASRTLAEKTHPSTCCSDPFDLFKGCLIVPIRSMRAGQSFRSSAPRYHLLIKIQNFLIVIHQKIKFGMCNNWRVLFSHARHNNFMTLWTGKEKCWYQARVSNVRNNKDILPEKYGRGRRARVVILVHLLEPGGKQQQYSA